MNRTTWARPFALASAVEPMFVDYTVATSSAERSISTRQVVDNIMSIAGRSAAEQTEATKMWRLYWWDIIIDDTVHGPHFWTGRGFGLNLADADGFQDGDHKDLPPLRSPHNVNMTMLARAGIPGAALWGTLILSWFAMLLRTLRQAARRGETAWAGALLFACCYVMAMLINASFDVALEGPMLGIWFWCLIGFGIGTTMVYRARPATRP